MPAHLHLIPVVCIAVLLASTLPQADAQSVELRYRPESGQLTTYNLDLKVGEAPRSLRTQASVTLRIIGVTRDAAAADEENDIAEVQLELARKAGRIDVSQQGNTGFALLPERSARLTVGPTGQVKSVQAGEVDRSLAAPLLGACRKVGATERPRLGNYQWKLPVRLHLPAGPARGAVTYELAGSGKTDGGIAIMVSSKGTAAGTFEQGTFKRLDLQWQARTYYDVSLGRFSRSAVVMKVRGTLANGEVVGPVTGTLEMKAAPDATSAAKEAPGGAKVGMPSEALELLKTTARATFDAGSLAIAGGAGVCMTGSGAESMSLAHAIVPAWAGADVPAAVDALVQPAPEPGSAPVAELPPAEGTGATAGGEARQSAGSGVAWIIIMMLAVIGLAASAGGVWLYLRSRRRKRGWVGPER